MTEEQNRLERMLPCPDGFRPMTQEELARLYQDDGLVRCGIRDEAHHRLLTVYRHDAGSRLLSALADPDSIARSLEKRMRKGMKRNGYRLEGFYPVTVCGQETCGFRYGYKVQGIAQTGDLVVLKEGTACYQISWIARKDGDPSDQAVFREILGSLFPEA